MNAACCRVQEHVLQARSTSNSDNSIRSRSRLQSSSTVFAGPSVAFSLHRPGFSLQMVSVARMKASPKAVNLCSKHLRTACVRGTIGEQRGVLSGRAGPQTPQRGNTRVRAAAPSYCPQQDFIRCELARYCRYFTCLDPGDARQSVEHGHRLALW